VRAVRRYGVTGAATRGISAARRLLVSSECHFWYSLSLPTRSALEPHDLELLRPSRDELHYLEQLPTVEIEEAEAFMERSGTLWVAVSKARPAFACWTFRDATPLPAIQGGWQQLPPGVAGLAFSYTAPEFRGLGIAPRAWLAIAETLAAEDVQQLVTEVEEENNSSRRAVSKIGFAEVARTLIVRVGPYRRITNEIFQPHAAGFLDDAEGLAPPLRPA
jgi:RimJ/RimL family protein N-acetyltransferase